MLRNQVCGELINCVGKMMVSPKSKAPAAGTAAKDAGVVPARRRRRSRRDRRRGHGGDRSRDRSQGCSRNSRRSSRRTRSASEHSASYSEEQADEKPTYVGKFWNGSQLQSHWTSYSNLPESVLQEALYNLDPKRLKIHE